MFYQPIDEQNSLPHPSEVDCTIVSSPQNPSSTISQSVDGLQFSAGTNIDNSEQLSLFDPLNFENINPEYELYDFKDLSFEDLFGKNPSDFEDSTSENRPEDEHQKSEQLQRIVQSITDQTMSVTIQPPTDIRRRYESDGKRQIEKSRSKPMTIKLPGLQNCSTDSTHSFWLQLSLITTDQNPQRTEFLHTDKLEYHDDDSETIEDGCVRVQLTREDITKQIKQLARISIVKKKLQAYTFQLKPYDPFSTNSEIKTYDKPRTKSIVAKAKYFRNDYQLDSSRIACQILIKQNETFYLTNIGCKTDIMKEKQATKRSASVNDEKQISKKFKSTTHS